MSSNTIFSSVKSEKRWVLEMEKYFPKEHILDINFDTPPSIFRVPKTLTETNPQAYTPQQLGLGPYHHLRPELYSMQNTKLAAVKKYLHPKNSQSFQKVVNSLIQSEPLLRQCYDQYLDLDIQTLAWILTIDGLYLLHFLENYLQEDHLTRDIMMLENQIPVIILNEIVKVLQLSQDQDENENNQNDNNVWLFNHFHYFCQAQSPLKLNEQRLIMGDVSQMHLIHRMYHLIVNNRGIQDESYHRITPFSLPITFTDVNNAIAFLDEQGLPGASTAKKILSCMGNVPWNKIKTLFKKGGSESEEQNPSVEEIDIPSVTRMSEVAGIKFELTSGGIRDIQFNDQGEEKKFYLPVITLSSTSEIILRNLVAFEAAFAATLEFTEYVDLMCGIIDSPKDVGILRKGNIIQSELPDEEIVLLFNGIGKSLKKSDEKSKIEETIDQVNEKYNSVSRVKVVRFLKKYVYGFLKILSVLVSIAVLMLIVLNSYCSVFGCGLWFGRNTVTLSQNLLWSEQ